MKNGISILIDSMGFSRANVNKIRATGHILLSSHTEYKQIYTKYKLIPSAKYYFFLFFIVVDHPHMDHALANLKLANFRKKR